MFQVIISSLDNKRMFVAYKTNNENNANFEFNRICNLMQRNAIMNELVDQKALLVFGVSELNSFTPTL